jgi:hypothetical protein
MEKNRTRACVKSSATMLDMTIKENGVKTSTSHWELAAGGDVLTLTVTALRPNGPVVTDQIVASRISGSNDFAGQWRDTSYLQQHAVLTLRVDSRILHLSYPRTGQFVDAPFDGADAPIKGPNAANGWTYSARLVGRHEFVILTKHSGTPVIQGSLELSHDGRIITESWWNPDQPGSKGTLVYEK